MTPPHTTFAERLQRLLLLLALLIITYPVTVYFNAQKMAAKAKTIRLPAFNFNKFKMPGLSIQKVRSAAN